MAHSVEGAWKKYTFQLIEKAEYPIVIKHLEENFHRDEPVTVVVGNSDLQFKDLQRFTIGVLNDSLSIAAWETETRKLAAVSVTSINLKSETSQFQCDSEEQATIFGFFDSILEGIDLFDKYGVDKYAELVMASVCREFRGDGLATELYERTLKLLKELGFKLAKSTFTSPYTRKISVKYGFEEVARKYFRELQNARGEYLSPNANDDQFVAVKVLRL